MSCNYKCSVRWLVGTKHFPESKTHPRIQKHFPESKNTSQNPKQVPKTKNTSKNPKYFPESKTFSGSGTCFGFWEVFLNYGMCFGFREVFLDSGKCSWILGRVFEFLGCVLSLSATVVVYLSPLLSLHSLCSFRFSPFL